MFSLEAQKFVFILVSYERKLSDLEGLYVLFVEFHEYSVQDLNADWNTCIIDDFYNKRTDRLALFVNSDNGLVEYHRN